MTENRVYPTAEHLEAWRLRPFGTPDERTIAEDYHDMYTTIVTQLANEEWLRDAVTRLWAALEVLADCYDQATPAGMTCKVCHATWTPGADKQHTDDCPVATARALLEEIRYVD